MNMKEIHFTGSWDDVSKEDKEHIADRIGKVMSEILSDKYDAKITIKFKLKDEKE